MARQDGGAAHVSTSNASNLAPILGMNERLGFEETIAAVTYRISRAALAEWLATA